MANRKTAFGSLVFDSLGWASADHGEGLFPHSTWQRRTAGALLRAPNMERLGKGPRFDRLVLPGLNLDDSLRTGHGILYLFDFGAGHCAGVSPSIWGSPANPTARFGFCGLHSAAARRDQSELSSPFQAVPGTINSTILSPGVSRLHSFMAV